MKSKKDLEQQQAFENISYSKEDEELYSLLFSELDKEKDILIKPSFAPNIAAKLTKKKKRDELKENLLFGGSILMVLVITALAFQFVKTILQSQESIIDTRVLTPVTILAVMITIFQVLDKAFIRNRKFRRIKHKTI
jgi:hypothetical protein